MTCLGVVPHPEKCCACRSNTKEYLESIQNRTPLHFTEDDEGEHQVYIPDLAYIERHLKQHFFTSYTEEMHMWYDYCICNNLQNLG